MKDIVGEDVGVAGGEMGVGCVLLVNPEKDSDGEESHDDGNVGQA